MSLFVALYADVFNIQLFKISCSQVFCTSLIVRYSGNRKFAKWSLYTIMRFREKQDGCCKFVSPSDALSEYQKKNKKGQIS